MPAQSVCRDNRTVRHPPPGGKVRAGRHISRRKCAPRSFLPNPLRRLIQSRSMLRRRGRRPRSTPMTLRLPAVAHVLARSVPFRSQRSVRRPGLHIAGFGALIAQIPVEGLSTGSSGAIFEIRIICVSFRGAGFGPRARNDQAVHMIGFMESLYWVGVSRPGPGQSLPHLAALNPQADRPTRNARGRLGLTSALCMR